VYCRVVEAEMERYACAGLVSGTRSIAAATADVRSLVSCSRGNPAEGEEAGKLLRLVGDDLARLGIFCYAGRAYHLAAGHLPAVVDRQACLRSAITLYALIGGERDAQSAINMLRVLDQGVHGSAREACCLSLVHTLRERHGVAARTLAPFTSRRAALSSEVRAEVALFDGYGDLLAGKRSARMKADVSVRLLAVAPPAPEVDALWAASQHLGSWWADAPSRAPLESRYRFMEWIPCAAGMVALGRQNGPLAIDLAMKGFLADRPSIWVRGIVAAVVVGALGKMGVAEEARRWAAEADTLLYLAGVRRRLVHQTMAMHAALGSRAMSLVAAS
jgi:hypothetical protein